MKYFIIAGEASGDLHASNLMRGINENDPDAQFMFFGGDLMLKQGGQLIKHYKDMAFMGFIEVLQNLNQVSKNLKLCKQSIKAFNPDVLILVDYAGFNLRIAKYAKKLDYKVVYYIAPKVWAWKESRVKQLRKYVDKLIIIFPFEEEYFMRKGVDAVYLGNPLVDTLQAIPDDGKFIVQHALEQKPIISLLAGSRKQEIKHNLPVMLTLIKKFPQYQFVIAGAPSLSIEDYKQHMGNANVPIVFNQTQNLLRNSTVAVVTSGTATLEAALYNIPEVVCYKGSAISMLIAWMVIRVKYISLVNLIMDKEVVKELIQFKLNPESLYNEVSSLLPGEQHRNEMLDSFLQLRNILGESETSSRVAKFIIGFIK
ncbi:MAG: lipid-A-disaccharide synthase [Tenuifilaceae bacterium]|nr:lipid-A-disaccharide synthase [Tenuifilaceae bacterium]